jgi:hypothetical protein
VEFKFPTILIIDEQRTLEPLTPGGEKGKGKGVKEEEERTFHSFGIKPLCIKYGVFV